MGRIKNQLAYPLKATPSPLDYIVGSDYENDGDTVNFTVASLLQGISGGGLPNEIISGTYEWVEGTLTFNVYNLVFRVGGVIYGLEDTTVTFENGSIDPRTDLLVVDIDDGLIIIKGTPSISPTTPIVEDATTQLPFFTVNIDALATVPTDASKELIWDENVGEPAEWSASENTGGARIILPSTETSNTLLNSIKFSSPSDTDALSLTKSSVVNINGEDSLEFNLYINAPFDDKQRVKVQLYNGVTAVSNVVTIINNQYNFSRTKINAWQYIAIPLSSFSFSGSTYDRIDITTSNLDGVGKNIYLDTFSRVSGLEQTQKGILHSEIELNDGRNPHGTLGSDIPLDTTNFDNNLDNTITDVQKLADSVDELASASGLVDFVSNVDQNTILGRLSSGNGNSEELTAEQVRTFLNVSDGATANNGTVTSVSVSGSDGIEVDSGSPITASGTIAIGLNAEQVRTFLNVSDGATANNGTVTSVSVSGSDGIEVDSGSPITASGTIAIGLNASTTKTFLKDRLLENATVTGSFDLNYSLYELWNLTLTGATTFTESNLEEKTILIRVTGDFALTFPANWGTDITGTYDGTVSNIIVVQYFKSGVYKVQITQPD